MPQDQVLSYPILAGGSDLDQASPGLLFPPAVPQKVSEEQGKLEKSRTEVQYPQPPVSNRCRDLQPTEGMQEGMRLLPGAQKAIPTEVSEQLASSGTRKQGQEAIQKISAIIQPHNMPNFNWKNQL